MIRKSLLPFAFAALVSAAMPSIPISAADQPAIADDAPVRVTLAVPGMT
ncbi:MAG: hypothetical protein QOD06_1142 [Candidatus Binatota bacterium]|jgi:hypothetical protein|nr:hypothetical protein [Candidatus Binatota bacterium]